MPEPRIWDLSTKAAKQVGIDPKLYRRLVMQGERSWKGWQTSPKGAAGPSQLMPGTAAGLESKYGINTKDFYGNLLGGAYYLKEQLRTFKDPRKAVAAYNAGPGAVQKYGGIPPYAETQRYVQNIFRGWDPKAVQQPGQARPRRTLPGAPQQQRAGAQAKMPDFALQSLMGIVGGGSAMAGLQSLLEQETAWTAKQKAAQPKVVAKLKTPPGQRDIPVVGGQGKPPKHAKGIVALAQQYLGTPYAWGGGGPSGPSRGFAQGANYVGFDCSSFLQFCWAKQGVQIPRVTYDQFKTGRKVPKQALRPGDAVFFHPGARGPEHVGMYIGNGKFIEAPKTGDVVKISQLAGRSDYMGARRYG